MERSKKTSFDFYMLPLVLTVAVVPLLTMMTAYSSGIGKYTWASGGSFVDFFLGFKRGALILLGAVLIILFCAAQWMRVQAKAVWTTKNQKIVLILLAVFWGVTAISALLADEKISDCIEQIKDYAEDSLPVLNDKKEIIGIITAQDVTEAVDDEMGEDYAKFAGLTAEEDLNETTKESIKKRLPWLIVLLFLGIGVSAVVGVFEGVVAVLPIVICFQSLILDMAGNVGTQSLAVTIRVLMDEKLSAKDKFELVIKEMKVGFSNGIFLGILTSAFLGIYIYMFKGYSLSAAFLISGCVGASLLLSMIISSLVGTLIPMFFHKMKIDPAVASGPLITTINDLVAVVVYYSFAWVFLIEIMKIV